MFALGSTCFFERYLAGAETLCFAVGVAQQQRALVIDAGDGPVVPPAAFEQSNGFTAQYIITIPEIRERLKMFARGKRIVGEQHAADQRRSEPVEIERCSGHLGERDRAAAELAGPACVRGIDVE